MVELSSLYSAAVTLRLAFISTAVRLQFIFISAAVRLRTRSLEAHAHRIGMAWQHVVFAYSQVHFPSSIGLLSQLHATKMV